ncbi:MAG TPA: acyl-CoA synthetase [Thermohalobaculum sp.]|nr:acyl-CoA synthetase [Thermohalobaculum sp.]
MGWATLAELRAIEDVPLAGRWPAETVHALLRRTAGAYPGRPALSFQLRSGPRDRAETLDWAALADRVTRTANLFRHLGIGAGDTVAYVLPNCNETALALLGGLTAGVVAPINPLLDTRQIAAILRETRARVLVTLAPFPRTDIAAKAHAAAAEAGTVETILEVDLRRYLAPPLAWLIPLLRPRTRRAEGVRVIDFRKALMAEDGARLFFDAGDGGRVAAYFHTGGTTGAPKVAQHCQRGMIYNGLVAQLAAATERDVLICPLPLFHVFGAYPILMACVASGAHMVMPTPAGYRGAGVMDNFWKLVERWGVTFMVMVPTAASALMQRPVHADVSTLKYALCGSAPMPAGLFRRFEEATGVRILEGYGMTEATCLVAVNPVRGERKIGSVGLPVPYTEVRILECEADGTVRAERGTDEIGEICVRSPGVFPGYLDTALNEGLFTPDGWLRTGDLGRIDADGYVWITGRSKDLIIRGGHNIDPALIEEALLEHEAVALAGAIGQPDAHAGELPCAYVELKDGAGASVEELMEFARETIPEDAAVPKHIEILDELPKTAVGKVLKPELRRMAIRRVLSRALEEAGIAAEVEVAEDASRGLVARVTPGDGVDEARVAEVLGAFAQPWELAR